MLEGCFYILHPISSYYEVVRLPSPLDNQLIALVLFCMGGQLILCHGLIILVLPVVDCKF